MPPEASGAQRPPRLFQMKKKLKKIQGIWIFINTLKAGMKIGRLFPPTENKIYNRITPWGAWDWGGAGLTVDIKQEDILNLMLSVYICLYSSVSFNISGVCSDFYPAQYRALAGSVCWSLVSVSWCNNFSPYPPLFLELYFCHHYTQGYPSPFFLL